MTTTQLQELCDEFLSQWQYEDLEKMTLSEYVGVKDKNTFCQWVETKTRRLGSIKGMTSIKFGIYLRKDANKKPKNYANDSNYSWLKGYGNSRTEAFQNVKRDILRIVKIAEKGNFEELDKILLPNLFKWKVAFLYSNERLIPIYKQDVMIKIGNAYGLNANKRTPISEIQEVMILNKPAYLNTYQYMRKLYDEFGKEEKDKELITSKEGKKAPYKARRKRKGVKSRNTEIQTRTITRSFVVEQRHNKIQESLMHKLIEQYGESNVILEEDFVDVKLIQDDYLGFYEVKSSPYASQCVKEAIGQVMMYVHYDLDERPKKVYVVGQYPPTESDIEYIEYMKRNLKLEFDYINVPIK